MSRPHDSELEYRTLVLGTTRSPGVVTLTGHDRYKKWEIKSAKGQAGASTTLNGDDVGQFTATFYLADDFEDPDDNQFERWEIFRRLIDSTVSGPKPFALPVYHPELAANRFTEVTSGGIGGGILDGRGGISYPVKFLEYAPPKPKRVARPSSRAAGPGGASGAAKPDPNAAAKAELTGLLSLARLP